MAGADRGSDRSAWGYRARSADATRYGIVQGSCGKMVMSLLQSDEQRAIATEARRLLSSQAGPDALLALVESIGRYDTTYWDAVREQGWIAAALPEAHGGLGLALADLGLIALEIGRVLAGAPFLTSSFGAARALLAGGSDAARAWVRRLADGSAIGVIAFAEGQDVLGRRVRYEGGGLYGTKYGVSGGLHGDVAIVLAEEAGVPVLLAAALDAVERHAIAGFDNGRCTADLRFEGTRAALLARGPDALAIAGDVLAAQAVVTAHEQAGGAEALMERARDYALTRRAFGQPIGAFQSVKHRIAELYVLVELARAAALSAAVSDGTADFLRAAAAARLMATEAYDTCARDCVQIHGGVGVTWEAGLHLHVRRARSLAIEQGNMIFWEDVLVDELAREAA